MTSIESHGVSVVSLIAASRDDWDSYETGRWLAVEEWLASNEGDPDASEVRSWHDRAKRVYLRHGRDLLGWAIFVCRTRPLQS